MNEAIAALERAVTELRAADDELEAKQEHSDGQRREAAAVAADAH